jgi:hypothetical protein
MQEKIKIDIRFLEYNILTMNTYQRLKAEKPNYMEEHSKSVAKYLNEKYKNDEEFRERKRAYQRDYRRRKREEKNMKNNIDNK